MLDSALPSLWASAVYSWLTPTIHFVLLNLVIGTIVVTSRGVRRASHDHLKDEHGLFHHHFRRDTLARSPSIVLERLKSIGSLYRYRSVEIPAEITVAPAPATLSNDRVAEEENTFETLDEAYQAAAGASSGHHFSRSQSDSHPTACEMPAKLPGKLKKSAFAHIEEQEVAEKRPATARPSQPGPLDEPRLLPRIKYDDKLIQAEGVESLSEFELRQACRECGYLGLLSKEKMRQQLRDWLDLSLNHSVPSSLLILSRAFTVSGKIRPEEAVVATLSSLPDEVVDTVGTGVPSEDFVSQRRRKLEFLEMQEELIKEEVKEKEKEEKAKMDPAISQEDVALSEMTIPTTRETQDLAKAKLSKKHDQFCNISRALAVLASASITEICVS